MDRIAKEVAYTSRQGQTFVWRSYTYDRVGIVRFTDLGHQAGGPAEVSTLGSRRLSKPRTVIEPETFRTVGSSVARAKLDERLRVLRAPDVTKLRSLDTRISKLMEARREHLEASFGRADRVDPDSLRDAVIKKRADAATGYRGKAAKVKTVRRD